MFRDTRDCILNFQILFGIRDIELKMSKHIRRTCLRSVALKVKDNALIWMFTSAKTKRPVNAKCYRKEILSSGCLLFIYVGLHTDYISAFTCCFGYSQSYPPLG